MQEIQEKYNLIQMEQIHRGWSGDRKYCAIRADGVKYFLRISNIEQLKQKRAEFEMMQKISALGIPMCEPIDFGTCAEGVYSLQTWVNGKDAEEIIPLLPDTGQYAYGLQAGRFLRTIHTLPALEAQEEWAPRFNRKIDRNIQRYKECSVHFKGDAAFMRCIEDNRPLLENRPQSIRRFREEWDAALDSSTDKARS